MRELKSFNDLKKGDYIQSLESGKSKSDVFIVKKIDKKEATIKQVEGDRKLYIVPSEKSNEEMFIRSSRDSYGTIVTPPATIHVLTEAEALAIKM